MITIVSQLLPNICINCTCIFGDTTVQQDSVVVSLYSSILCETPRQTLSWPTHANINYMNVLFWCHNPLYASKTDDGTSHYKILMHCQTCNNKDQPKKYNTYGYIYPPHIQPSNLWRYIDVLLHLQQPSMHK